MERLRFCTDEHVPHSFVTALVSNGFTVLEAVEEHGERTVDPDLLRWCDDEDCVFVTNDRDFVELAPSIDHAGVVLYTSQTLSPADFVRGVRRIDRQFTARSIRNEVVWLEQWV